MTSIETPAPRPLDDDDERPPRRWPFVLTAVVILTLLGAWIYVLFFYDPGLLIDELSNRDFPDAAEQVCAAAVDELAELPQAYEVTTASDRAESIDASNVILVSMLDQLEPLVPDTPVKERDGINDWIADWRAYVVDRSEYAENLRSDPEARFLESPKGSSNKGITRAIDGFAQVNRMTSCATPADVS